MSGTQRKRNTGPRNAGVRAVVLLLVLAAVIWGVSRSLQAREDQAADDPVSATAGPVFAETVPAQTAAAVTVPPVTPEPTPGPPAVDLSGWELRLIDYDHPLGEDFAPPALTEVADGQSMDSRVAPAMTQLIADAKAAGYGVYFCSGYRDYDTQYAIYWNHINNYLAQGMTEEEAHAATRLAVNYPGSSEHQSGLCADILESWDQEMEPWIGGSGLMLWLEEHCAQYGFVVRYPDGKTGITGVEYEPWHLRYVGTEAAAYMMEKGLCLEEFLDLYS